MIDDPVRNLLEKFAGEAHEYAAVTIKEFYCEVIPHTSDPAAPPVSMTFGRDDLVELQFGTNSVLEISGRDRDETARSVSEYLRDICAGRYQEWEYVNSDDEVVRRETRVGEPLRLEISEIVASRGIVRRGLSIRRRLFRPYLPAR